MKTLANMMPFAQRYPLSAFREIAHLNFTRSSDFCSSDYSEAMREASALDQADREALKPHEKMFEGLVRDHLTMLLDQGHMKPISGLGGRNITEANAWNAMVEGQADTHQTKWVVESLSNVLMIAMLSMPTDGYKRRQADNHVKGTPLPITDNEIKSAWEAICNRMDSGSTDNQYGFELNIKCNDSITDDRCRIVFTNWIPTLLRSNAQHKLEVAQDVAVQDLITAQFNVPTGKLLISDAFRIEEFNKATDFGDREYQEMSLNSEHGRNARRLAHAKEHNIGYTQTTNTSVAVHRNAAGDLLVTERWGDEDAPVNEQDITLVEGWDPVGAISCAVWAIKAIDKQNAIHLIEKGGGRYSAKMLEACMTEKYYGDNILEIDVDSGPWTIHSGENFNSRVDRAAYNIPADVTVWCVFQKKEYNK